MTAGQIQVRSRPPPKLEPYEMCCTLCGATGTSVTEARLELLAPIRNTHSNLLNKLKTNSVHSSSFPFSFLFYMRMCLHASMQTVSQSIISKHAVWLAFLEIMMLNQDDKTQSYEETNSKYSLTSREKNCLCTHWKIKSSRSTEKDQSRFAFFF